MKNKTIYSTLAFIVTIVILYITFIILGVYMPKKHGNVTILIIVGSFFILLNIILVFRWLFLTKKKREDINKSFNYYVENLISSVGVGMIFFDENNEVVWTSDFIEKRIKKELIGKKLINISKSFEEKFLAREKMFYFELNGATYECQVNLQNKVIIMKDITIESMVTKKYAYEKLVLGELEIDNFQQLQTILPEEELFKAQTKIIEMLDSLVDKYNVIYRQYVNGKYIIITNKETLDVFIEKKFNFLDKVRKYKLIDGVQLTASIGFGASTSLHKKLVGMAKDGLLQAQSRGGDQIGVNFSNMKTQYFGSKTELTKSVSRVQIKQIAKLLEEKLSSNKIKKVIIYGHKNADLDAVGAALGLCELAKAYDKEVYIQNTTFDATTKKAIEKLLTKEQQQIFIKSNKASKLTKKDNTIIAIVDTAEINRTENPKTFDNVNLNNVFIFDHHRVSKLTQNIPSTNVYIDTRASSTSEIIVEVLIFSKISLKIHKEFAQMLLNGIYLDTKQFQNSSSSRTFQAAAYLEKQGALPTLAADYLKLSEEDSRLVTTILSQVKEIKPGYFLSSYQGEIPLDVVSVASDEILRTKGRKAAFVIAKIPGKKEFKLSARGIETNVQIIAEEVGGGGHFAAAAATSKETLDIFTSNVIQAIVSQKEDK